MAKKYIKNIVIENMVVFALKKYYLEKYKENILLSTAKLKAVGFDFYPTDEINKINLLLIRVKNVLATITGDLIGDRNFKNELTKDGYIPVPEHVLRQGYAEIIDGDGNTWFLGLTTGHFQKKGKHTLQLQELSGSLI